MKNFLGIVSVGAAINLFGDCFVKELSQNQVISIAGIGVITSIWYFCMQVEAIVSHYFKTKS